MRRAAGHLGWPAVRRARTEDPGGRSGLGPSGPRPRIRWSQRMHHSGATRRQNESGDANRQLSGAEGHPSLTAGHAAAAVRRRRVARAVMCTGVTWCTWGTHVPQVHHVHQSTCRPGHTSTPHRRRRVTGREARTARPWPGGLKTEWNPTDSWSESD